METVVRSKFYYYFLIYFCLYFDGLLCLPIGLDAALRIVPPVSMGVSAEELFQQNLLPQQLLQQDRPPRQYQLTQHDDQNSLVPDSLSVLESPKAETSHCSTLKQAAKQLTDMFGSINADEYPQEIVFLKDVVLYNAINNGLDIPGALNDVSSQFGDRCSSFDAMIAVLRRLRFELPSVCPLGALIDKFTAELSDRESEISRRPDPNCSEGNAFRDPSLDPEESESREPTCPEDGRCPQVNCLYDLIKLLIEKLAEKDRREIRSAVGESAAGQFHSHGRRHVSDVRNVNNEVPEDVKEPRIFTYALNATATQLQPVAEQVNIDTSTAQPTEMSAAPKPEYRYARLTDMLQEPKNRIEKLKYDALKSFLSQLLKDVDVATENDLLEAISSKSLAPKLEAKIVDAIKYYLNYETSSGSLTLLSQKQIGKKFELTSIFIDALDLESLTDEQRDAFDLFYDFVLNLSRMPVEGCDALFEVKTRADFMKVFFQCLLSQEFVPENIKNAIEMLTPIIQTEGPGANPP